MDAVTSGWSRRRGGLLAVILGVALAAVAAIALWPGTRGPRAAPAPATTAAALPVVAPPTSSTPPPPPVVPHDAVAKAGPTRFRIEGAGFAAINAHVCAMVNERPLDPPGEQHHTVCWVRNEFGVAPSSASATTYVLGHSWGQDANEVLNRISAPATKQLLHAKPVARDGVPTFPAPVLTGAVITLWTPGGRLKYRVRDAFGVDKLKLGNIASVMDDTVRNRVVLITCAERNGRDYPYNVVAEAYLVSSAATYK